MHEINPHILGGGFTALSFTVRYLIPLINSRGKNQGAPEKALYNDQYPDLSENTCFYNIVLPAAIVLLGGAMMTRGYFTDNSVLFQSWIIPTVFHAAELYYVLFHRKKD